MILLFGRRMYPSRITTVDSRHQVQVTSDKEEVGARGGCTRTFACIQGPQEPPQESWGYLTGMLETQDILAHEVLHMVS